MSTSTGATPSCVNCPAYLAPSKVKLTLGKDYGAHVPACARHGIPLARTNSAGDEVIESCKAFAGSCANFGEPIPMGGRKNYHEARIMKSGDPDVLIRGVVPEHKREQLRSCELCINFVDASVVHEELGFDLPLCAASGRLLFESRFSREPKHCMYAEPVFLSDHPRLTTTKSMELRPEYGTPVAIGATRRRVVIEPSEYPSDFEVSDEDRAAGIRAWRLIPSQEDPSLTVPLPIYDANFFDEDVRAEIPVTGGEGSPELYVDHNNLVYTAAYVWSKGKTPFLLGHTGVGKTEGLRHIAWLMQLPFVRIGVHKSTEVDHLVGTRILKDGQTDWVNGRLTEAWPRQCVLVIDEANMAVNDLWEFLRPLLDDSKQFALDAKDGTIISKHIDNYFAVTGNPAWDMRYVGVQEISPADMSRLSPVWVDFPPEDTERTIIVERCKSDGYDIPADTVRAILAIAKEIRNQGDALPIVWGVRNNINVALMTQGFNLMTAYRLAGLNALDPITAETIMNIVKGFVK